MITLAVKSLMQGNSTLNGVLSGRYYPNAIPQNPTYPLITFRLADGKTQYTLDNKQAHKDIVQVDIWAKAGEYTSIKTIENYVKNVLSGYSGIVTMAGDDINILVSMLSRAEDLYDPDTEGVHRVSLDFTIWYKFQ